MWRHYTDILSRVSEPPTWWDEHAVPRFCDFAPDQVANIYADQAALVLIECQNCGAEFRVAFSWWQFEPPPDLMTMARACTLHFGDPPNAGCCPAGPTMNSVPRRVLQLWERSHIDLRLDWVRRMEFDDRDIAPEWVTGHGL